MKSFKYVSLWTLAGMLVFAVLSFGLTSIKELLIPEHLKHDIYDMFKNMLVVASSVIGAVLGLVLAVFKLNNRFSINEYKIFAAIALVYFLVFTYLVFF